MKDIINSLSRSQKKLLAITFDIVLSITATSFAIFIYFNMFTFFNLGVVGIYLFFIIGKLLGLKKSRKIFPIIFKMFAPFFKSKK